MINNLVSLIRKNIPLIAIVILIFVVIGQRKAINKLSNEVGRQTNNFYQAQNGFETRLDKLGKEYQVTNASVLTKREFSLFSENIYRQLDNSNIKIKNVIQAGMAGIEGNYKFKVLFDTIYTIENLTDTVYKILEYYQDPEGWFKYEKKGAEVKFETKDSIFYATIKEKPKKDNGQEYGFISKLFKRKTEKFLFKSLNPYNDSVYFFKVNKLKQ